MAASGLWYFRWAYSIRNSDGLVTELGDGFSLTFSDLTALDQPTLRRVPVAVADGLEILVAAGERRLSGNLLIGWRGWTCTCEPLDGSSQR